MFASDKGGLDGEGDHGDMVNPPFVTPKTMK